MENKKSMVCAIVLLLMTALALILALLPVNFGKFKSDIDVNIRKNISETFAELQQAVPQQASTAVSTAAGKTFVRNGNEDVNLLVACYYKALIEDDAASLARYTDKVQNIDPLVRSIYAKLISEVTDLSCYTMNGMLSETYIVVATSYMHFKDFDSVLPNLNYFYICTDGSGNLYISNVEPGEDVQSYNQLMYKNSSIVGIINQFAAEYDAKLDEDEALADFLASYSSVLMQEEESDGSAD